MRYYAKSNHSCSSWERVLPLLNGRSASVWPEMTYYLDLLFFHRRLSRLIAVELKLGEFKPADSGQMELYLRWLDRHERQQGEGNAARTHPMRWQEERYS